MKVRIRFAKRGIMKFIGHLDLVRYFQKAFRRAEIDVEYSGGFSPHQLMSFAAPLSVGLISEGEYLDIFVNQTMSSNVMLNKINHEMAEGIEILSCKQIIDETKHSNAMSIVTAADYYVSFSNEILSGFNNFITQDSILVMKKSKKSEKQVDIKPMIHQTEVYHDKIYMLLDTGSTSNLKPELVMEAFFDYCHTSRQPEDKEEGSLMIQRLDMYALNSNNEQSGLISLDDLGVEIV